MSERETYIIILRKDKRSSTLSFNIGGKEELMTLLKLVGKNVNFIFKNIVSILSKYGAISPIKISDREEIFTVREDLGPIIGGFLILFRRSRNPKKWLSLLNDVLEGKYPTLVIVLENYVAMALEMSRVDKHRNKGQKQALTPIVLDASSTSLKAFAKIFLKNGKKKINVEAYV